MKDIKELKENKVFNSLLYSAILLKESIIPFDLESKEFIELFGVSKEEFIKELDKIRKEFNYDLDIHIKTT